MLLHNPSTAGVLVALAFAGPVAAQTRAEPRLSLVQSMDQLAATRRFLDVALSPDGRRVAWVEGLPASRSAAFPGSAVYTLDLGSAKAVPRRVDRGAATQSPEQFDLAWSPDGAWLAYLSDAGTAGQAQVYLAPAGGGPARKLTSLRGSVARPGWSPDGKTLAVLFTENAGPGAAPSEPVAPGARVVAESVAEQRLTTVDVATRKVRQLSPAGLHVYEYDWSPDGRQFVVTAARGSGDNHWYLAEILVVDVATGQTRLMHTPTAQIANPRWAPDAKNIAFIGGLMSDEGSIGGDVFVVPIEGGRSHNVTPGMKASASWLSWQPGTNTILFAANLDGGSGLATVSAAGGSVNQLWVGPETVTRGAGSGVSVSLAADGKTTAAIRHSYQEPPEVWVGPIGAWKQVTHANAGRRPVWGEARSLHWKSSRFTVQGWLVYPREYDPQRRYPMIVQVHGGPASAARSAWPDTFHDYAIASNAGYFVFFPNFRGSFGQGATFVRANVKDFGGGDLGDILAGVDEIVKTLPVDGDRVGITGWSYGGFMTMWALTQTDRFRAGVAGAGLANWQSYYGQSGIAEWMTEYFGKSVYDDPDVYAKSSPINFIKNAKTPTLIIVGENDVVTPPPQSYEYWHALKTLGVKTRLVVYPGEGHHIRRPEHRLDLMQRGLAWFDEYLRPRSGV